jgi:hypothetical protein
MSSGLEKVSTDQSLLTTELMAQAISGGMKWKKKKAIQAT